ncbi:MAG: 23S rRNA (uracil(1939)-C(5))-methyltransferase RlmD [Bacteroidales bacterium]|jgi:23S rRNA (uracil1939-C5)-methyltransferase|nr:23S rRNA (uracil(1939)-C(5))-methyltransferase RlmD [Bacteroidales bacterium]MDD2205344.1 23S rRNA (uracil(1939)-C(5))-methyltransferase RlmD [Bacteroidales bacterium]MDD3152275.1 23S rRNA (uracil(1939)-C(5))-methyltransferase RlmD [Bacteroidales bacterium]MDD3914133.1 23S rRNA (uracil(1939)-C(5))-methyltransferase RlmD [Bacteroidales bacterium]MDD4634085.1 23S rRNA (uracil(1939)-C(5))-methyltransferase RlmD [Bacteroidales bacterium]
MKNNTPQIFTNVDIIDAASDGNAVGKTADNLILFVPYGAPGDNVDVQVTKKRKSFKYGKIIAFNKLSENRVEPKCEHYTMCGGCKWQHLNYKSQLFFKQKQVADALTRIAKVNVDDVLPILPSDNTEYYRNKLEFTFSDFRWMPEGEFKSGEPRNLNGLGFHLPGMFDRVIDVKKCYLQAYPSDDIRLFVKNYALEHELTFYNVKTHSGLLRNLMIRQSNTGGLMVVLVVNYNAEKEFLPLLSELQNAFPQITSLMYIINDKFNDDYADRDVKLFYGEDHLVEEMENFKFIVSPKSFYQTNHEQAYKLYKVAREFANLTGKEIVYDLYTGTGTIAVFVSAKAKKVVGIEYVEQAVNNAVVNAEINGINNLSFFTGDMAKILTEDFIAKNGTPDVIITDPPRAGMHPDVINQILKCSPERIVYVSCNPATQARDIALLSEKYDVKKVQPVDMFPHTQHVENVALLELITNH